MADFLYSITNINIIGPIVILICISIFLATSIFFFIGLSGKMVLGGNKDVHTKTMNLLMKVLAVEIITSCTLYFGAFIARDFNKEPVPTYMKGSMTVDDRDIIIDLNRYAPRTLVNIKNLIDTAIELKTKKDKISLKDQIKKVAYLEPAQSIQISLTDEFDINNVTEMLSFLSDLTFKLPTREYTSEKKALIIQHLNPLNPIRCLGRIPNNVGEITIGEVLKLDFSRMLETLRKRELYPEAKEFNEIGTNVVPVTTFDVACNDSVNNSRENESNVSELAHPRNKGVAPELATPEEVQRTNSPPKATHPEN